jgi:hypothetical protein
MAEENKASITYDNNGAIRAVFALESDKALFEGASELLEAVKELMLNLDGADEDRDEEGNVYPDIARVKKAIARMDGIKQD